MTPTAEEPTARKRLSPEEIEWCLRYMIRRPMDPDGYDLAHEVRALQSDLAAVWDVLKARGIDKAEDVPLAPIVQYTMELATERGLKAEADLAARDAELLECYVKAFPNYAWTDRRHALDLLLAEITTCRTERADRDGELLEARKDTARLDKYFDIVQHTGNDLDFAGDEDPNWFWATPLEPDDMFLNPRAAIDAVKGPNADS